VECAEEAYNTMYKMNGGNKMKYAHLIPGYMGDFLQQYGGPLKIGAVYYDSMSTINGSKSICHPMKELEILSPGCGG
jgi:hypothetical protein